MRVKAKPSWKEALDCRAARIGTSAATFFIRANAEYTVYGVSFRDETQSDSGEFLEIVDDDGNLVSAPNFLFDIVDERIPETWIAKNKERGLCLWPKLFFKPYFFDDLSDGVPEIIDAFSLLRSEIAAIEGG